MSIEHIAFFVFWMERLRYVTCGHSGKIVGVPATIFGPVRGILEWYTPPASGASSAIDHAASGQVCVEYCTLMMMMLLMGSFGKAL
jgi:hypothetical protein